MPPKMKTPKCEASSRPAVDPSDLSDAARRRLVASDVAKKRAVKAFTNVGAAVPPKLQYHAVPEYDHLRAAARCGQGSSSGSGEGSSSGAGSSSRAMVRRVPPEEEVEGYDADTFGRSLSSLDFVPENTVDAVVATICERLAAEEPELEAQRRRTVELNDVFLEQAIAASLTDPVAVVSSDKE